MSERKSNEVATSENLVVKLTRVFHAPRRLVFEACTKKEHLDRWLCPRGFTIESSSGELREGGAWRSVMIAPDGERLPVGGAYQKIVPNELLVFTHAWEGDNGKPEHWTTVTMCFDDAGQGQTRLEFEQKIMRSVESRDNHAGGWTQGFDKLGELLDELQHVK